MTVCWTLFVIALLWRLFPSEKSYQPSPRVQVTPKVVLPSPGPGFKSFQEVLNMEINNIRNSPTAINAMCYRAKQSNQTLGRSYMDYLNQKIQENLNNKNIDMVVRYTADKQLFPTYCPGTY